MRNLIWLVIALAGASLLLAWRDEAEKPGLPQAQDHEAAPAATASGHQDTGNVSQETKVLPSGKNIDGGESADQPETELRQAETAVSQAEARLDALSLRLDSIEAQVADIEARGDDPAEHADEVMVYMQPVLDEFLDAEAALDAAIEHRNAVKATLDAALVR